MHRPCASISLFAERNPAFVDTKFLETSEGTHGSPNGQGAPPRPVPWEERAGTRHSAEMVAIVLVSRPPTPVPWIRHWMPRTQGRRSEASRSEWKRPCLCRGHGWWLIHPPPPPLFKLSLVYQAYRRFQINTDSVLGILLGNVAQTPLCCPGDLGVRLYPDSTLS